MKVGDTWIPFCRAYFVCHLISRSRVGMANASANNDTLPRLDLLVGAGLTWALGNRPGR